MSMFKVALHFVATDEVPAPSQEDSKITYSDHEFKEPFRKGVGGVVDRRTQKLKPMHKVSLHHKTKLESGLSHDSIIMFYGTATDEHSVFCVYMRIGC